MTHYIGQRVRINCPKSEVHGAEATVIALGVPSASLGRRFVGIGVDIPNSTTASGYCAFEPHELIPITNQHQPAEMDVYEMLPFLRNEVKA